MSTFKPSLALWIDLGGGVLTAALVGSLLWMVLLGDDAATREINSLKRSVASARVELASLRGVLDDQSELLARRRSELSESGQLPDRAPIERDLRTLHTLARQHDLRVTHVSPLAPRKYPDLLELRYAIEVVGTTPNLTWFFKSIEDAQCWADISYLKVESGTSSHGESSDQRVASLTISLFSSRAGDEEPEDG
jgi:Tfp pilus assembly protein PilO